MYHFADVLIAALRGQPDAVGQLAQSDIGYPRSQEPRDRQPVGSNPRFRSRDAPARG